MRHGPCPSRTFIIPSDRDTYDTIVLNPKSYTFCLMCTKLKHCVTVVMQTTELCMTTTLYVSMGGCVNSDVPTLTGFPRDRWCSLSCCAVATCGRRLTVFVPEHILPKLDFLQLTSAVVHNSKEELGSKKTHYLYQIRQREDIAN